MCSPLFLVLGAQHLPNDTLNHTTSRVAATLNQASNACIRVGLDWGNGALQQTLEPFRVGRGAILNPTWVDTASVGLGITEGASDQGDPATTANEAECVLWPGSLGRWYQATYPYYVPPPSPVSWNGRTSEDYTWAVALSTYDYLDIEPARHAVGHLTTWGRAADRDRTRRKVPIREDASHPGYGMTDTRYTVGSTNTVVSTQGIAIVGRDVEALAHSSTDELPILSALDDYIPGLVGLEE